MIMKKSLVVLTFIASLMLMSCPKSNTVYTTTDYKITVHNFEDFIENRILLSNDNELLTLANSCKNNYFDLPDYEIKAVGDGHIIIDDELTDTHFLNPENSKTKTTYNAIVISSGHDLYIVMNLKNIKTKNYDVKSLICHELAHTSSGTRDHSDEKYVSEANRLFENYGIEIPMH